MLAAPTKNQLECSQAQFQTTQNKIDSIINQSSSLAKEFEEEHKIKRSLMKMIEKSGPNQGSAIGIDGVD